MRRAKTSILFLSIVVMLLTAVAFMSCGVTSIVPDLDYMYVDFDDSVSVYVDSIFIGGAFPIVLILPSYMEFEDWEFTILPEIITDIHKQEVP